MNIITTKKIIASAIISIMLMGLVTPIFAATTTTGTVKNNTYIYASKSTNGTKTAEIYKGQTVTVSSTNGDWCQVTWQVNTAYAHKSYVNSSNEKVKSGGPNLYSNYSNKKVSNKIGDLKQGNLKILDSKNYGNYYKVSVNVTGYIKKADLNIKTNTTSSTTSNKPTTSSSGSTTSILASLLQITFKGAETGIGIISSLLSGIGGGRPSKSLELNKTSITIEEGNTEKITAKVNNKTVTPTYTSSNTKIATVDKDGTIKAKGEGETKITARWDNKTATCKVTVTAKAQTSSSQQPTQSARSFLQIAIDCKGILTNNKFSYGNHTYNYRTGAPSSSTSTKTIDCSGYVSWVIYEYAKERNSNLANDFEKNKNTGNMLNYMQNHSEYFTKIGTLSTTGINNGTIKSGDILIKNGHVEIYASYNSNQQKYKVRCYNAGNTTAIQNNGATGGACNEGNLSNYTVYRIK